MFTPPPAELPRGGGAVGRETLRDEMEGALLFPQKVCDMLAIDREFVTSAKKIREF